MHEGLIRREIVCQRALFQVQQRKLYDTLSIYHTNPISVFCFFSPLFFFVIINKNMLMTIHPFSVALILNTVTRVLEPVTADFVCLRGSIECINAFYCLFFSYVIKKIHTFKPFTGKSKKHSRRKTALQMCNSCIQPLHFYTNLHHLGSSAPNAIKHFIATSHADQTMSRIFD